MLRQHVRDAAPAAPARLGADLAWQSATKYLAGHSDVLAGVVTTRDSALRERLVWTRRTIGGCSRPTPRGCSCAACAPCTCACRVRSRPPPSSRAAWQRTRRARGVLPGPARAPGPRARAAPDAGRRGRRAGLRARRRGEREALRGRRAARPLRDQPGRRRDADRVPCARGAGGSRARGPASALRRPRGRRRPVGGSRRRRSAAARRARCCMECFGPWSPTRYSSAASSTTPRAASPPRSTARRRSSALRAEARPTGAGTRPSPPRPRRCWAPSRTPRRRCSRAA